MDDIDRLMNNMRVPPQLRDKVRKQLQHQLEQFGQAQLAMPANDPMGATVVPVPPGLQFKTPMGPKEAMVMEEVGEEDDGEPQPTLTECYMQDVMSLKETIGLIELLQETGSEFEKQELVPKLECLRVLMSHNMASRAEDAAAMIQLDEHNRRDMQAHARYGRWQQAVAEGRTRKSYKNWVTGYEKIEQGPDSGPEEQNDRGTDG